MNGSEEERLSNWNTMEAKKYIVHDVFLILLNIFGMLSLLIDKWRKK
jgi:hypothetical protein